MYTEKVEITYLDSKDIKQIVAEKYGVSDNHVEVEISEGDPQYPDLSVCVIVKRLI